MTNLEILCIDDDAAILICDQHHNDVVEIHHDAYSTSRFPYADAVRLSHMIVAAPQLLASLQELLAAQTPEAIAQAKAAIAAAQGSAAHV